jgi:hypothetical protein
MVIKKEKNVIKLFYVFFPLLSNVVIFLIKIADKKRCWVFTIYLFFIFFPSALQAGSLSYWNVGLDLLNTSPLIAIQLNENIFNPTTVVDSFSIHVKNAPGFNKWFSEVIRDAKEIILFVPYLYEQMNNDCRDNGADNTYNCRDWVYFHIIFWPSLVVILVMNCIAQQYIEQFPPNNRKL